MTVLLLILSLYIIVDVGANTGLGGRLRVYGSLGDTMPLVDLEATTMTSEHWERKQYALGVFFKANWFRAAQYCKYRHMALASISNKSEELEVEALIENVGFEINSLWTSGTDTAQEGEYYWMSSGDPITYTKWHHGQPDGGTGENCLSIKTRGGQGFAWNDAYCTDEYHFVCEYYPSEYKKRGFETPMFI